MECIKNSLVLRLWRLCQQWMGLGLSFYATLILRNICVPRDFDATLPKHRKRLPAELQLTAGFHLRRTCWRANSAGFWHWQGVGWNQLGEAISTFQTHMPLSDCYTLMYGLFKYHTEAFPWPVVILRANPRSLTLTQKEEQCQSFCNRLAYTRRTAFHANKFWLPTKSTLQKGCAHPVCQPSWHGQ